MPTDLRRPVVARRHAKMTEKLKTAFGDGETSFFWGVNTIPGSERQNSL